MSEPVRIEPEMQRQERAEWLALFSEQNAQLKLIVRALEGIEAHAREIAQHARPMNLQQLRPTVEELRQYPQGYQRALSPEEIAKQPTQSP
jgi:hypothetical protein